MNSSQYDEEQEDDYQDYLQQMLRTTIAQAKYPHIEHGTVFKGYKTIQIQKLHPNDSQKLSIRNSNVWASDKVKEVYCYEQSCPLGQNSNNGFFWAFYRAYYRHGDVKITPDDVWSVINLYFSAYVNKHSEKLREAFVSHQGKIELVIQTANEISEYEWNQFFQKVIIAVKQNTVKGVTQQFQCDFSTTDRFFQLFSTATIMNSYKQYFDYKRYIPLCGINNVHMGGTLRDWQRVVEKTKNLYQYDVDGKLKLYLRRLQPVLKQFVQTYKGNVSRLFWDNIYSQRTQGSGYTASTSITGWILRFFSLQRFFNSSYFIPLESFDIPIKVVNEITGKTKMMNLLGGSKGISIEGNVFRPHYSFSIVEYKEEK